MKKYFDSIKEIIVIYLSVIFVASILFSIVEHKTLFDSIWWSFVTAMTVGYGDMYPVTVAGKLIGIALMHVVTLFIIPLFVGQIVTKMIDNKNEFTHDEQEGIKKLLTDVREKLSTD